MIFCPANASQHYQLLDHVPYGYFGIDMFKSSVRTSRDVEGIVVAAVLDQLLDRWLKKC